MLTDRVERQAQQLTEFAQRVAKLTQVVDRKNRELGVAKRRISQLQAVVAAKALHIHHLNVALTTANDRLLNVANLLGTVKIYCMSRALNVQRKYPEIYSKHTWLAWAWGLIPQDAGKYTAWSDWYGGDHICDYLPFYYNQTDNWDEYGFPTNVHFPRFLVGSDMDSLAGNFTYGKYPIHWSTLTTEILNSWGQFLITQFNGIQQLFDLDPQPVPLPPNFKPPRTPLAWWVYDSASDLPDDATENSQVTLVEGRP